jgi:hypothetical protein
MKVNFQPRAAAACLSPVYGVVSPVLDAFEAMYTTLVPECAFGPDVGPSHFETGREALLTIFCADATAAVSPVVEPVLQVPPPAAGDAVVPDPEVEVLQADSSNAAATTIAPPMAILFGFVTTRRFRVGDAWL